MLDDHHRIAAFRQLVQNIHQLVHVCKVQSRGRLVQNINGLARTAFAQLRGQFDPLRLTAGQRRRGLAQLHIGQSHIIKCLDLPADGRQILKKGHRLLHGHVQHIINILTFIFYFQRLSVITPAAADLTGHIDIRQEMHLDLDDAVAAAGFASAALHIETEPALAVASGLGILGGGEQISDLVEHSRIGGRIRTGCPADGRLIDVDHLVQLVDAFNSRMSAGHAPRPVQVPCQMLVKDLVDQRTLAGARDTRYAGHDSQRDFNVDLL